MMTKNQLAGIQFFLQNVSSVTDITFDENGDMVGVPFTLVSNSTIDLEKTFVGLTYSSAKGLLDKGKIKNIYKEVYADSNLVRTWHPSNNKELVNDVWVKRPKGVTREATKVKFTFAIVGENRQQIYENFYKEITSGIKSFYDTKRNMRLIFVADGECKPPEELWYGSMPWLKVEIEVSNLFGECFPVNQ